MHPAKRQATKDYVRNYKQKMQNKPNFRNTQMNVTSFGKRDYDDLAALRLRKNKPNSKPNKPNFQKAQNERKLSFDKGL